jgi:O-methyltransferase
VLNAKTSYRLQLIKAERDELPIERTNDAAELYLDLLKRCLTRPFPDSYEPLGPKAVDASRSRRLGYSILRKMLRQGWDIAQHVDLARRMEGRDWPSVGETMIWLKRLDNLHNRISDVVNNKVDGDFIEVGAWRGGGAVFMRAALRAFGDTKHFVTGQAT